MLGVVVDVKAGREAGQRLGGGKTGVNIRVADEEVRGNSVTVKQQPARPATIAAASHLSLSLPLSLSPRKHKFSERNKMEI